ncbi:Pentatricopeptide repeat-containing protein [Acorus calamus]|uniref:Pentatricopeptide repeat-containing protein n=1 Tax=Acorus calamus TaxID=4465 RepID=A0AAV9DWM6_ACOCL|nr:Pentatricopeptide repeat-containing protein [Acorus calamus]
MDEARIIFDNVVLKNSFLWNSMIRGYAVVGSSEKSLLLYREMSFYGRAADNFTYPFVLMACGDLGVENLGRCVHCKVLIMGFESDIYVGNSLLMMYLKFGDIGTARKLFDAMPERDLTSWNTMISGMSNNGDPLLSLVFLNQMVGFGVRSDRATILSVLPACADMASLKHGKEIHGYVIRCGLEFDGFVRNSLIEMYSRCRFMTGARHLFEKMVVRDLVSWNSMISGYSWNEDSIRSISIFRRMISEE